MRSWPSPASGAASRFIEPSLGDAEFFLRKGIGWALRSLAYEAPEQVRRYVRDHAVRLSALSQKEALRRIGR
jgi:3-methyladenine DNA glycosylase AlkD